MRILIGKFWAQQRARGQRPKSVYALVSTGADKPEGFIKAWSPSRRHVDVRLRAEWNPENWKVEKLDPPA